MPGNRPHQGDRLRVVVVNYNSGELLARCVQDVLAIEWDGALEVVVVDNASTDDSLVILAEECDRTVRVVALDTNSGFGANNVALTDLEMVDWVALVNPDAFVSPNFATGLVAAFGDGQVGAVSPKIVFDDLFSPVEVSIEGDGEVRLLRVALDGEDVTSRVQVLGDTAARLPVAHGSEWHLDKRSTILIPSRAAGQSAQLSLSATAPTVIDLSDSSTVRQPTTVRPEPTAVAVTLTEPARQYIQNAGSSVDRFGVGHGRGFLTLDSIDGLASGPFDHPTNVFAWCGAAVLMSSEYLLDVGLFEPEFFLYYEDTDLSWRAQSRGWTHTYVPDVVVRHRHSASTVQGSAITDIYQQRNRLRMLGRNASLPLVARGIGHSLGAAAKIGGRRALAVGRPGAKGHSKLFARRARGIASAASDIGSTIRARRELDARRTVSRHTVEAKLLQ